MCCRSWWCAPHLRAVDTIQPVWREVLSGGAGCIAALERLHRRPVARGRRRVLRKLLHAQVPEALVDSYFCVLHGKKLARGFVRQLRADEAEKRN